MDSIRIKGGRRLVGRLQISGAKNAALPLMAATLLTGEELKLTNVPRLADIKSMQRLLEVLGTRISDKTEKDSQTLSLFSNNIIRTEAPYELVRKMRASILVLGPLLARCGKARVSLPGGCAIGNRPVDLHLGGLEKMGASIDLTGGYIEAKAPGTGRLKGARIAFPTISVGATENLMMAATIAEGETEITNAAREPEIIDLADCLIEMGACIEGHGTHTIRIQGKDHLHRGNHRVISDRIETGTYAIAACITGGDLELLDVKAEFLGVIFDLLERTGANIMQNLNGVRVRGPVDRPKGIDVATEPYPGFPTDLQAQMMAYMSGVEGSSIITETIFDNRFMHVPELNRMGANITVNKSSALVKGVTGLRGAPVMATDLRASVSLVLAGLVAKGDTMITRIYHLDRGYQTLVDKLSNCGANIERISEKGVHRDGET